MLSLTPCNEGYLLSIFMLNLLCYVLQVRIRTRLRMVRMIRRYAKGLVITLIPVFKFSYFDSYDEHLGS